MMFLLPVISLSWSPGTSASPQWFCGNHAEFCFFGDGQEFSVGRCTFTLTPRLHIIWVLRCCSVLESVCFAFSKICPKCPNSTPHVSVLVCSGTQPAPRLWDFSPWSSSARKGLSRQAHHVAPNCTARSQLSFKAQSHESWWAYDPPEAQIHIIKALLISGGRFSLSYNITAVLNVAVIKHTLLLLPWLKIADLWGMPLRVTFHFPLGVFNLLNQNFSLLHSGNFGWSYFAFCRNLKRGRKIFSFFLSYQMKCPCKKLILRYFQIIPKHFKSHI